MSPTFTFAIQAQVSGATRQLESATGSVTNLNSAVQESSRVLAENRNALSHHSAALQESGQSALAAGKAFLSFSTQTLGGALQAGASFEAMMNEVAAASRIDLGSSSFQQLEEEALSLGSSTKFSASQAAEAMKFLTMSGFSVNETLESTAGVLDLASAGSLELGQAADISSDILSGYSANLDQSKSKAEQLAEVSDTLASTFTRSNTDLSKLGEAYKYVGSVAASSGVSFAESAAALGVLADSGRKGSQGGTDLRGILLKLKAPSGEAAKALGEIDFALEDFQDSAGNLQVAPMLSFLSAAKEAGNLDTNALKDIFGLTGITGAEILLENVDRFQELTKANEDAQGTAGEVATKKIQGLQGAITLFQSAWEGLKISLADSGIQAVAEGFVRALSKVVQFLSNLPKGFHRVVSGALTLVGVIGAVLIVAGSLLITVGAILGAMAALPPALAVLGSAFAWIGSSLIPALISGFVGLLPVLLPIAAAALVIYKFWGPIKGFMQGIAQGFKDSFKFLQTPIAALKESLASFREALQPVFALIFGNFSEGSNIANSFGQAIGKAFGGVIWVLAKIAQTTATVISFFGRFAKAVGEGARSLLNHLSPAVEMIVGLGSNLKDSWNGAVEWISGVFKDVKTEVTSFTSKIKVLFAPILSGVSDFLGVIWGEIGPVIPVVTSLVSKIFSGIRVFLAGVWEKIEPIFTYVGSVLAKFFSGVKLFFGIVADVAKPILSFVVSLVVNTFSIIMLSLGIIWEVVKVFLPYIVDLFVLNVKMIMFYIRLAWVIVKPFVDGIMFGLSEIFKVVKGFVGWVGSSISFIFQWLAYTVEYHFSKWIFPLINELWRIVSGWLEFLTEKFNNFAEHSGEILKDIQQRFDNFKKDLRVKVEKVTSAIMGILDSLREFASDLLSKIGIDIGGGSEEAQKFQTSNAGVLTETLYSVPSYQNAPEVEVFAVPFDGEDEVSEGSSGSDDVSGGAAADTMAKTITAEQASNFVTSNNQETSNSTVNVSNLTVNSDATDPNEVASEVLQKLELLMEDSSASRLG